MKHKAMVIKTVWYWCNDRKKGDPYRRASQERDVYVFNHVWTNKLFIVSKVICPDVIVSV